MGEPNLKPRIDVLTAKSEKTGVAWAVEHFFRRFRTVAFALYVLPLGAVSALCLGLSAAPGLFLFDWINGQTADWLAPFRYAALGCGISFGFYIYGVCLILIVPLANFLIPLRVKPFRGPVFSLEMMPWYFHNALTYLVRYTFLEFVTPSPYNILFYRLMGMKIGKGVVINTTNISDPCMITLGDNVTVGGSAHIFAHSAQKGFIIIEPLNIGAGTTIGLKASVMGGSEVGKNVTIRPHAVVLPKMRIPDGGHVE